MNAVLIRGARLIDPTCEEPFKADLLVRDGRIKRVGDSIETGDAEVYDASGKWLCPGFIDMNAHLCESWQEVERALETGTRAAVKGGFTTVCAMADTNPPLDNQGMIGIIRLLSRSRAWSRVIPAGCATQGLEGKSLAEIGMLISAGAGLIFDAGRTIRDPELMRRLMEYSKMFPAPLFLHCEETSLTRGGLVNEGELSTRLGLPGIPSVAEDIVVARDLQLAGYLDARIHIAHVSTRNTVAMIRDARKRGVRVTCGVTPHHVDLTEADITDFDTNFKIRPPLRTEEDRQALVEGLQDGTIDAIATDHVPCSLHDKQNEFERAPFGIVGLETAFSVCFERLVRGHGFTPNLLMRKLTSGPARILGIDRGTFAEGAGADLVVVNPECSRKLEAKDLVSKSKNSPYLGKTFTTAVEACWVEGVLKYREGRFVE
jgi:dihydroorotase